MTDFKQLLNMVLEELLSFVQELSNSKTIGEWQGTVVTGLFLSIAKNFEHESGTQVRTVMTRIFNICKDKMQDRPVLPYMSKLLNE